MRIRLSHAPLTLAAILACVCVLPVVVLKGSRQAPAAVSSEAAVDRQFEAFSSDTPGCAVGVSVDGATVLRRGYGMADLERGVPIAPDTVFEAGSVSKQFTAAAVLLLEADGLLRLDDPVRRYLPEVPETTPPVTIRQMLQHTSGLRDWGSLAGIAGWPRTTRVHTHAHVLEIVSRQTATNFAPGTHWSYSNTGYNLAAILVARVSGRSFAEFTRDRLFAPLGLRHTSWRDDHRAVVRGRALAYEDTGNGYATEMPFETVHGNGGLLTTVDDLLIWTRHLQAPGREHAAWVSHMHVPVSFSGAAGRGYGLGLMIDERRGVRQVDHSGSTAGYLAHLAGYPDQRMAVAVLCNVTSAGATARAYGTADIFLSARTTLAAPPTAVVSVREADLDARAGLYRSRLDGRAVRLVRNGASLRIEHGAPLLPQSSTHFVTVAGQHWRFSGADTVEIADRYDRILYDRADETRMTPDQLAALVGQYRSTEADTTVQLSLDGGQLTLHRAPETRIPLEPLYRDAFSAGGLGTLLVNRTADGSVGSVSVMQDRVWNLRFTRDADTPPRTAGPR